MIRNCVVQLYRKLQTLPYSINNSSGYTVLSATCWVTKVLPVVLLMLSSASAQDRASLFQALERYCVNKVLANPQVVLALQTLKIGLSAHCECVASSAAAGFSDAEIA